MVKISKKYIPKLKEKYMCAKHLAYYKQKLIDWKAELVKNNNKAIYNGILHAKKCIKNDFIEKIKESLENIDFENE